MGPKHEAWYPIMRVKTLQMKLWTLQRRVKTLQMRLWILKVKIWI